MRTVSDQFLAELRRPHEMVTTVDVLFDREVVDEDLAVVGGHVTFDRNAAVLARCDVMLAEPYKFPTGAGDILSPYGYEIRVKRGIRHGDGRRERIEVVFFDGEPVTFDGDLVTMTTPGRPATTESVSLGIFPIQRSEVDGVSLVTNISTVDRSQQVRDARLEDDYTVAAGTNYATAIEDLISAGVSDLEFAFASTTFTTPLLVFEAQADRWEAAQSMAKSIGCELFFNGDGVCTLRPEPDLSTATPVWDFDEGADGVLLSATVALDRSPAYNRVVAFSTNASTGEVFRGVWTDDDPSSPTYYFGPFGKKPRFFGSPLLASNSQAVSAAAAIGRANIGVARSLALVGVTNPALEAGDVVRATRSVLELDEVVILDELSVGLGPEDPMTAGVRARQEEV